MKKIWGNILTKTKESFMKYPVSFVGIILYTLFITIFIDEDIIPNDILLYITISTGIFVALTINIENIELKKKTKIIYDISAALIAIVCGIVSSLLKIYDGVSLTARYYSLFLVTLFLVLILCFIYTSFKKQKRNFIEYFKHVFFNITELLFKYGVLAIGVLIITSIFSILITDNINDKLLKIQLLIEGWYLIPFGIIAFVDNDKKDSDFLKLVFNNILSILLFLAFIIIYLYIFKIIILFDMPSNEVFPILAFLFLVGGPIWTINSVYEGGKIWNKVNKYFPYAFVPFIILQIIALGMRIGQYGITETRYLGIILIIFEIAYEIMYIFRYKLEYLLFVTMGLISITFICPWINMTNVSINSQFSRLENAYNNKSEDNLREIAGIYEYFRYSDPKMEFLSSKYSKENLEELKQIHKNNYGYMGIYDLSNYSYIGNINEMDITGYTKMVYFEALDYKDVKEVVINNKKYDMSNMIKQIIDEEVDFYKNNEYELEDNITLKMTRVYINYDKDKEPNIVEIEGYAFIK